MTHYLGYQGHTRHRFVIIYSGGLCRVFVNLNMLYGHYTRVVYYHNEQPWTILVRGVFIFIHKVMGFGFKLSHHFGRFIYVLGNGTHTYGHFRITLLPLRRGVTCLSITICVNELVVVRGVFACRFALRVPHLLVVNTSRGTFFVTFGRAFIRQTIGRCGKRVPDTYGIGGVLHHII